VFGGGFCCLFAHGSPLRSLPFDLKSQAGKNVQTPLSSKGKTLKGAGGFKSYFERIFPLI